jgi:hypothetical protein
MHGHVRSLIAILAGRSMHRPRYTFSATSRAAGTFPWSIKPLRPSDVQLDDGRSAG